MLGLLVRLSSGDKRWAPDDIYARNQRWEGRMLSASADSAKVSRWLPMSSQLSRMTFGLRDQDGALAQQFRGESVIGREAEMYWVGDDSTIRLGRGVVRRWSGGAGRVSISVDDPGLLRFSVPIRPTFEEVEPDAPDDESPNLVPQVYGRATRLPVAGGVVRGGRIVLTACQGRREVTALRYDGVLLPLSEWTAEHAQSGSMDGRTLIFVDGDSERDPMDFEWSGGETDATIGSMIRSALTTNGITQAEIDTQSFDDLDALLVERGLAPAEPPHEGALVIVGNDETLTSVIQRIQNSWGVLLHIGNDGAFRASLPVQSLANPKPVRNLDVSGVEFSRWDIRSPEAASKWAVESDRRWGQSAFQVRRELASALNLAAFGQDIDGRQIQQWYARGLSALNVGEDRVLLERWDRVSGTATLDPSVPVEVGEFVRFVGHDTTLQLPDHVMFVDGVTISGSGLNHRRVISFSEALGVDGDPIPVPAGTAQQINVVPGASVREDVRGLFGVEPPATRQLAYGVVSGASWAHPDGHEIAGEVPVSGLVNHPIQNANWLVSTGDYGFRRQGSAAWTRIEFNQRVPGGGAAVVDRSGVQTIFAMAATGNWKTYDMNEASPISQINRGHVDWISVAGGDERGSVGIAQAGTNVEAIYHDVNAPAGEGNVRWDRWEWTGNTLTRRLREYLSSSDPDVGIEVPTGFAYDGENYWAASRNNLYLLHPTGSLLRHGNAGSLGITGSNRRIGLIWDGVDLWVLYDTHMAPVNRENGTRDMEREHTFPAGFIADWGVAIPRTIDDYRADDDVRLRAYDPKTGHAAVRDVSIRRQRPPNPPATAPVLSIGDSTETTVEIVWTAVSNAESYELEVDGTAQTGLTERSAFIPIKRPATPVLRVRAVNRDGDGPWGSLTQMIPGPPVAPTLTLSAPRIVGGSTWGAPGTTAPFTNPDDPNPTCPANMGQLLAALRIQIAPVSGADYFYQFSPSSNFDSATTETMATADETIDIPWLESESTFMRLHCRFYVRVAYRIGDYMTDWSDYARVEHTIPGISAEDAVLRAEGVFAVKLSAVPAGFWPGSGVIHGLIGFVRERSGEDWVEFDPAAQFQNGGTLLRDFLAAYNRGEDISNQFRLWRGSRNCPQLWNRRLR